MKAQALQVWVKASSIIAALKANHECGVATLKE